MRRASSLRIMSDENPPKKQKHVLLGAWLNEPGEFEGLSFGHGKPRRAPHRGLRITQESVPVAQDSIPLVYVLNR